MSSFPYCCCCCSFAQSCLTLCDPMDCSTTRPPCYSPNLPEFAQVHVHCINDAVQPSHPLMPSSPPALSLSQHQGLFQWVVCSHQMTQNTGTSASASSPASEYSGFIFLKTDWFDLCCPRDSQESSPAPQFEGINSLAFCLLYGPALTTYE